MSIWQFNLRHLAAAANIAELGTINAAALAVNLSQPAITQALGRIEAQLGLPLFERRHNGMVPTEAAGVLVPRIRAALTHIASPHVTMARLRALLALADAGSYAGASIITGLSLPSLHRAVNDLALAMRRPLVVRRGKGVMLTEAGTLVARRFRLARGELETGLSEIAALNGHETRRIAIGAMPLSRARVLPAAVTRFLRRHPNVRISITEGARSDLVEPLRNGTLDLMIGALREPLVEPEFAQRALFRDMPAVIGRKGHPLEATAPGLADLARYPWTIAARGAPLRDSWERLFSEAGCPPPPVPVESGSVMTIRQILIDSDFLTLLSPDQVEVELQAGWLARIADLPPALGRTIGVTTRAGWRPTRLQDQFFADLDWAAGQVGG
ncbi:LysR substrate-binding domain-containing protein [Novosphingobium lentum]|uniref:LysR substrate-binding domain-containing protein n=1 Tax=Novosphingobium lentum TaxID=145287 RepID=UPI00082EC8FD|nr:LysR substrate-binding domain-containing protein [Novosphingobium lentum]